MGRAISLRAFLAVLGVLTLGNSAFAGRNSVTGIGIVNDATGAASPNYIGDTLLYTAQYTDGGNHDAIYSVTFTYRCTDCAATTYTINNSSDPTWVVLETLLGNFEVTVNVYFVDAAADVYDGGSASTNVSILKPDGLKIYDRSVLNVPTSCSDPVDPQPGMTVVFEVTCNGRRFYVPPGTELYEKLDRSNYGANNFFNYGSVDWTSILPFMFIDDAGFINDGKGYSSSVQFEQMTNNKIFDEFDQSLRLKFPTGCGTMENCDLGPIHFRCQKTGLTSWQLLNP